MCKEGRMRIWLSAAGCAVYSDYYHHFHGETMSTMRVTEECRSVGGRSITTKEAESSQSPQLKSAAAVVVCCSLPGFLLDRSGRPDEEARCEVPRRTVRSGQQESESGGTGWTRRYEKTEPPLPIAQPFRARSRSSTHNRKLRPNRGFPSLPSSATENGLALRDLSRWPQP